MIPLIIILFLIVVYVLTMPKALMIKSIINNNKKIDGFTSHDRRIDFSDKVDMMKYDTVTGGSLGMSRGALVDRVGDVIKKDVLSDVLKIAGDIEEVAPAVL